MLTGTAYRLLATPKMPEMHRRVFLTILGEYDLRNFVRIHPDHVTLWYDFPDGDVAKALKYFVNAGLLELGPRINHQNTYRIREEFLLNHAALERMEANWRDRRQREALGKPYGVNHPVSFRLARKY